MAEKTKEQTSHPIDKANWLSRLTLYWMDKTLITGSKRKLTEDDLFPTLERNRMKNLTSEVERHWEKELVASEVENRKPRLWKALAKCFSWKKYLVMIGLRVLSFLCTIGIPLLLWFFLKDLSSGSVSSHISTYFYVLGISLLTLVKGVSYHHGAFMSEEWGIRLKVCCIGLIYKKILFRFNRRDLQNLLTGKAINLVSNDAQSLEKAALSLTILSLAPFEILASGFLLWYLIGWQALTGAVLFPILAVYICRMSHYCGTFRDKAAVVTDRRLEVMSEIVSGIRAVKMYAWEGNLTDVMKKVRKEEMSPIRKRGFIVSSLHALYFTAVPIAGFVSIATLIYTGEHVTAFQIFTVFSCLGISNCSVVFAMCYLLPFLAEANIAVKRIEHFIGNGYAFPVCISKKAKADRKYTLEHEGVPDFYPKENTFFNIAFTSSTENVTGICYVKRNERISVQPSEDVSLLLSNICCTWSNEERDTLTNISLAVKKGEMVAVTGPVGSGKSSLLKVILGELPASNGSMSCKGSIAYVPQIPWVFSGTVKENILFGKDFDPRKYHKVIEVCSLQRDLDGFPKGDLTQIGQRGVRLSGGQRQRVSLARALYSDAGIYLLDDPLSAVDAKVGQNLFESCICEILSERTRVLVTHHLHFLTNIEHIVVLNKGRVTYDGSYPQLHEMDESWLSHSLCNNELLKKQRMENPLSTAAKQDQLAPETLIDLEEEVEETSVGSVTWRTYWKFFKVALPPFLIYLLAVFIVGIRAFMIASYWWASKIAAMSHAEQKESSTLTIFGAIVIAGLLTATIASTMFFSTIVAASEKLHNRMVVSVIKAPVLFFDTNPLGRILNRFSKDIGSMDNLLPVFFLNGVDCIAATVISISIPAVTNVWLILAVVPLIAVVLHFTQYYLKSSRELKRLEAVTCSTVYAHITETLFGLEIIRCSQMEETFLKRLFEYQDTNSSALTMVLASSRWLSLRVSFMCTVLVATTSVAALLVTQSAALAGMSLVYLVDALEYIYFGIGSLSEVENNMTSVERVMFYTELDKEPGYDCQIRPPNGWPQQGSLTLQDLSLCYVEGGPQVLKDISLSIAAKEKVGIAGRTGAGKSSLVAALFRMPEPGGSVLIDGVVVGALNLQAARESMAVITQDPVLFRGSFRSNLDPFSTFNDEELWTVLEEVQMKRLVEILPGQLDYRLKESGSNFSAGERQLLCLARALVQRSKIIIMDEATANVDFQTDRLIQEVIRSKFRDSTVLTIAHRLNTIIDYDKVMVLDGGRVVEFDKPEVLMSKTNSLFAELVRCQNEVSTER